MSRTPEHVLAEMLAELPNGSAWNAAPDGRMAKAMTPFAAELARFEAAAEAMLAEADPRLASELLTDYERVLGPEPCLPETGQGLGQRRRTVHARWTARGGASIAFFVGLAAAYGVPITITEVRRSVVGRMRAGHRLVGHPEQFCWRVRLPAARVVKFRTGASVVGNRLGSFEPSFLECVIRRLAPAHTVPVFSYTGTT